MWISRNLSFSSFFFSGTSPFSLPAKIFIKTFPFFLLWKTLLASFKFERSDLNSQFMMTCLYVIVEKQKRQSDSHDNY